MKAPGRSTLRAPDLVGLGFHGLRAHPVRALLSALGIAIGIAAMIAVLGISTSSQALVREKLDALGTGLLTVTAGDDLFGNATKLDPDAVARVERIDGVQHTSWSAALTDVHVYRNRAVDPGATGALEVLVAGPSLLEATGSTVLAGAWLDAARSQLPVVVLGETTAQRLGITDIGALVRIGEHTFTVGGILERSPLAPELDTAAIVGPEVAEKLLDFDGHPTTIYEQSTEASVPTVRELLPATVDPKAPNEVKVSRPSDALAAANTVDQAFTGLLVGVGSIALLVGGIGVANTMVISVLERRREIGLRRSLGATRGHIRAQFLVEAMLLAAYGGLAGTLLGWLITAIVARGNGWLVEVPPLVLVAGVVVTVVVGAIAGVLPAMRAARTSPTVALAT